VVKPAQFQRFRYIDDPDRHLGNSLVLNGIRTESDGPEPLLTLPAASPDIPCVIGLRYRCIDQNRN